MTASSLPASPPASQPALKEWAAIVAALEYGHTILLLRKGGIREAKGTFTVARSRFWLFPTYEHQRAEWLKPAYGHLLAPAPTAPPPGSPAPSSHLIASWAEVTHTAPIISEAIAQALYPFHPWSEALVDKRLHWKPQQPLYALLLRVYRLESGIELADQLLYGGCKSWLEVPLPPMERDGAIAALDDATYAQQVAAISSLIPDLAAVATPAASD